jgi:hypothetical protein
MLCLRRWRVALLVALLCARATSARASLAYGSVDAAGLDAMTTKFGGDGVTVWDGRVIFAPLTSAAVGVFDPATNAFTLVPAGGDAQCKGGALANDGRVVFAPAADHSFVGVFDPETDTFTKFDAGVAFGATHPFKGAARLGDGRVAFAPAQATFVGVFDPATGAFAKHDLPASLGGTTIEKFGGAAATPDGCAVFSPSSADAAGKFCVDSSTQSGFTLTLVPLASDSPLLGLAGKFSGAIASDNGDVIFPPLLADRVGVYNFTNGAFVETDASLSDTTTYKFTGGSLLPDGRAVFVPGDAATAALFDPSDGSLVPVADAPPASELGGVESHKFSGAASTQDGRVVFVPSNAPVLGFARAHCALAPPANGALAPDCPALLPVGDSCAPTCDEGFNRLGAFSCAADATTRATCESPCETCARQSHAMGFVTRDAVAPSKQGLRAWFANADLEGAASARWVSRVGGFAAKPTNPNVANASPAPAPSGSWGIQTVSGHGAARPVTAVHGTAETGYAFGANEHVMPAGEWSLCTVTRYDGDGEQRVLQGSGNFVWGHYGNANSAFGLRGVAFVLDSGFLTETMFATQSVATPDKNDWLVMCGTNAPFRQSVFADGARVSSSAKVSTGQGSSFALGINDFSTGQTYLGETSAFAVAEVLVWDRALSDEELLDASEYLRREVLGVAPAPAPPFADRARAWFASADLQTCFTEGTCDSTIPWRSRVGNFQTVVTGTGGSVGAISGFGAGKAVAAIHGSTTTTVAFGDSAGAGTKILPAGEWSMCTVTRYDGADNGSNRGRLIEGTTNFFWGHYFHRVGTAFLCEGLNVYLGTVDENPAGIVADSEDWLVLCGTNGAKRRAFFANGLNVGVSALDPTVAESRALPVSVAESCGDFDIVINKPGESDPQSSDFAVAEVIVWDGALDDAELRAAGAFLREATLGIQNAPPPFEDDMHAWFASADLNGVASAAEWSSRVGSFQVAVTAGDAEVRRVAGAGAGLQRVSAVHGTTSTALRFGANVDGERVIPEGTFSMCTVARYDGLANTQAIWSFENANMAWGHAGGGLEGVSRNGHLSFVFMCNSDYGNDGGWLHHPDNTVALDAKIASSKDDWVVFCGTNGMRRSSFYANGVRIPAGTVNSGECSATGGTAVSINLGTDTRGYSDFAVAELVTWNRALTDDELRRASNYLRRTVLGHAVSEKE